MLSLKQVFGRIAAALRLTRTLSTETAEEFLSQLVKDTRGIAAILLAWSRRVDDENTSAPTPQINSLFDCRYGGRSTGNRVKRSGPPPSG